MKRAILFGATLSAALATALSAQTPQTSGARPPDQSSGSQVTVTGCLKSGDNASSSSGGGATSSGGATGAASAAGTSGSGSGYILTDAASGPASSTTGAAGTAGTPTPGAPGPGAGAMTSYRLQGGDESDLRKYVNSKVEVRGMLSKAPTSSTATTGPTGATGATGAGAAATRESGMSSNMPTLQVTSVRQVASSCTQ